MNARQNIKTNQRKQGSKGRSGGRKASAQSAKKAIKSKKSKQQAVNRASARGKVAAKQKARKIRREKKARTLRVTRVLIIAIIVLAAGVAAIGIPISTNQVHLPLTSSVKGYHEAIENYCKEFGILEYTGLAEAVMMQESKGKGTDPMQSSEGNFNKRYSSAPGSIKDPDYSIECGVHQLADALTMSGCKGPDDVERIMLALQGYNYGDGYITWALERDGKYTKENAEVFSEMMQKKLKSKGYGDKKYAEHVMRYYSY